MTTPDLHTEAAGGPAHLLVIDDVEASRYIVATWLRRAGHTVTEGRTGAEALELVGRLAVDLVILDVNLPDMTGFDVCERIKSDASTSALPVIHVSATAIAPEDRARGLTRGADAYLTEPVDPGVLVATVAAALRYSRARAATERLAAKLARLTTATLTLNTATSFDELIRSAAVGAATIMESPASAVIVTPSGLRLIGSVAGPDAPIQVEETDNLWWRSLVEATIGRGSGAKVIALPRAEGLAADTEWIAVIARPAGGRPGVCVAVPSTAVHGGTDRNLLLQWGQATALATENLRVYAEEHSIALTLQNSLLPSRLPSHPALAMAARYVPAATNAEIGGDFYEVTELDGRLLVAIGDVCGHSINAATIMGEVRHALRAYALEGHGPVEILNLLDVMLRRFHPEDGFTTLCLLSIDVVAGIVTVANAGHLPPLIVDASGTRYLDVAGPMLGIGLVRPAATEIDLAQETTIVLVTDGLIERRGIPLDDSMDELRDAIFPQPDLERFCDELLARFGQDTTDDIAILALRRRGDAELSP
ncbi:MAG TPA: fused response regulator/phosphatase [Pseudonocardiaceae bacterium]|nr:fused response regulator/phosphatase [Pseudonocardiaceae bacterium]